MSKSIHIGPGRPRIPTAIKKLRGTDRKDRILPNEISFKKSKSIPPAPKYFDKVGKQTWSKVTKSLKATNMLVEVDFELLTAYCFQVSIVERCASGLDELLVPYTNKAGATNNAPNPLIKIYNDALSNVNRLAAQFGFSPSSRSKISAPEKGNNDGFDEF